MSNNDSGQQSEFDQVQALREKLHRGENDHTKALRIKRALSQACRAVDRRDWDVFDQWMAVANNGRQNF